MTEENGTKASRSSIGLMGILTIIFVLAKIFDKIDWSWWWVFSPLWVPTAIIIGCLAVGIFIAFIAAIIDSF